MNVQLVPKTEIVEIHFRSRDPKLAADVANAVANTYIEHNFQTKYRATHQTSEWLTKQLDDLKTRGIRAGKAYRVSKENRHSGYRRNPQHRH